MHEPAGTTVVDVTGHSRHATYANVTQGQAGKYGTAFLFGGADGSKISAGANLTAAIDPNEFSMACWLNVNVTEAILAVRVFNNYSNSLAEYSAFEIRVGDELGLFLKEGGSTQTITSAQLPAAQDDTWAHVVFFNSVSTDTFGLYYNGTKYEFARTLAGVTPPLDTGYPELMNWLAGLAQHIAFWNRKLSQAEVNTICS